MQKRKCTVFSRLQPLNHLLHAWNCCASLPLNTLHCACTSPPVVEWDMGSFKLTLRYWWLARYDWPAFLWAPMTLETAQVGRAHSHRLMLISSKLAMQKRWRDIKESAMYRGTPRNTSRRENKVRSWHPVLSYRLHMLIYIWSSFFKRDRLIWNMLLDKKNLKVPSWIFKITLQEARQELSILYSSCQSQCHYAYVCRG